MSPSIRLDEMIVDCPDRIRFQSGGFSDPGYRVQVTLHVTGVESHGQAARIVEECLKGERA